MAEQPKLPRLGSLGASFSDDIVLAPGPGGPNPATQRGPTAFGDDIPVGPRVAVRVRLTKQDGRILFDYTDSDPVRVGEPRFALPHEAVVTATTMAVNDVLGLPLDAAAARGLFEVQTDPGTWVGAETPSDDPVTTAFGTARVYDVALGAMANAWPSKVGAGSCSLGAIVSIVSDPPEDTRYQDVLEGGRGASPTENGTDRWAGPVLEASRARLPSWLSVTESIREGSGGIGARTGGRGLERTYTATCPTRVRVAIDRVTNPPHGIDRAGPPHPAEVFVRDQAGQARRIAAWVEHTLDTGSTLVVRTAGGAGHGFPGWGVDWDPDSL